MFPFFINFIVAKTDSTKSYYSIDLYSTYLDRYIEEASFHSNMKCITKIFMKWDLNGNLYYVFIYASIIHTYIHNIYAIWIQHCILFEFVCVCTFKWGYLLTWDYRLRMRYNHNIILLYYVYVLYRMGSIRNIIKIIEYIKHIHTSVYHCVCVYVCMPTEYRWHNLSVKDINMYSKPY